MSTSSSSSGGSSSPHPRKPLDPISRTALRYTLSPREYELLHEYLISRAPKPVQKRTPKPKRYEKLTSTSESRNSDDPDTNVAALRAALRVFVAVYAGFKGYETVVRKLAERRGKIVPAATAKYANLRLALSFSSILLFHKLLHRFFRRLRSNLLEPSEEVAGFKQRNPKITEVLTSPYTPAVGAALSGFGLGISPRSQLRVTIAIYLFTRSLEFGFNFLESAGHLWKGKGKDARPWWFGSWMIMPFACGQLLHAFVFDRDCFPADYGKFILARSPGYIQLRPKDFPVSKTWPGTFDIVDGLASLSKLKWPPFISPILFPATKDPLPIQLAKIAPVTGSAHPAIKHTSCALLHPHDPSCSRTFLRYFARAFPGVLRFFSLIYGAFALLAYKSLIKDPLPFLNKLSSRILRMAFFITAAIGTSWGSICAFNHLLPHNLLPTQRWFFGGFAGGLWAFVARTGERGNFLYSARLSIDSLWKVGRKRGWWRGVRNGDVLLFVASLALLDVVYEVKPDAVQGGALRKGMSVMRGEGWKDRAAPKTEDGDEKQQMEEEQEAVLGETVDKNVMNEKKEL